MDSQAELCAFSRTLDIYPAGFSGNRLNLLMLEDAEPIFDGESYLRRLNSVSLTGERREVLVDPGCPWPFPRAQLPDRPDPWALSESLFARFEYAQRVLPTQRDIAEIIDSRVRRSRPVAVGLIIVDGLSYYDLPDGVVADPVLVSGITSTEFGYREVIGQPTVSRRLFHLGYTRQFGFTYFDAQANDLARDVYASFAPTQITRVVEFGEVLEALEKVSGGAIFVQITMAGLDQIAHSHWDRPPRKEYLRHILRNGEQLSELLERRFGETLTVLTSDHGILWREELQGRLMMGDDLFPEDVRSPRYIKGSLLRAYGKVCRSNEQNYTLLRAPYVTRQLRRNEWGVHGGISAWESLVPLIIHDGMRSRDPRGGYDV